MIKPLHIFLATILLRIISYLNPDAERMLNETMNFLLVLSLFNKVKNDVINNISIYALLSLNAINFAALTVSIFYELYTTVFLMLCSGFLSIIFYIKLSERIN